MNDCTHILPLLQDYLDGALPPEQRRAVDAHLEACSACRDERAALAAVTAAVAALPPALDPPRDLWPGIAARLETPLRQDAVLGLRQRRDGAADRASLPRARQRPARRLAAWTAGAALLLAAAGAFWLAPRLLSPAWEVARLEGTPRIGQSAVTGTGQLRQGQWLETDGQSRAALDVGAIGNVEVEPNTRLRLLAARPTEHRLALAEGTIHARIWAPPRLFFVETPSALTIDLGCEYTLTVDSTGGSLLHVTSGFVALEHGDRTAVVPAGRMCLTRPGRGPGTPFDDDASEAFRRALARIDFDDEGADALPALLAEARPEDAATLWQLIYRVDPPQRGRLYDRLVELVEPPEGATRAGVLRGDLDAVEAWDRHLGLDLDSGWFFQFFKKKKAPPTPGSAP